MFRPFAIRSEAKLCRSEWRMSFARGVQSGSLDGLSEALADVPVVEPGRACCRQTKSLCGQRAPRARRVSSPQTTGRPRRSAEPANPLGEGARPRRRGIKELDLVVQVR